MLKLSAPMMSHCRRTMPLALLALICVLALVAADKNITKTRISWDGGENYAGAYRLLHQQPLSREREPLPQVLLAGWLYAAFPNAEQADLEKVNGTPKLIRAKRFNLLWGALMVLTAYAATLLLTSSAIAGLIAAAIAGWLVSTWTHGLNSMYSEPIAAVLFMLIGIAAIIVVQRRSIWAAVAFGVAFACLALTKSIVLPIFFVAAPLLGLLTWLAAREWRQVALLVIASTIAFGAVVGPWVASNALSNSSTVGSARSAKVLYLRMLINEMPPETYRAAFYVWSPPEVRKVLERLFGFSPADLEKGGVGQWLTRDPRASFARTDSQARNEGKPELASSHLFVMRAELVKRAKEFAAQGMSQPESMRAAHESMGEEAKNRILADLPAHFKAMVPLAWRGLWPVNAPYWLTAPHRFAPPYWLAPLLGLSLPTFLIWAAFARRPDAFAFGMVPFGVLVAYLLVTQFHDRYVTPAVPVMCVSLVVLGYVALISICRHWRTAKEAAAP